MMTIEKMLENLIRERNVIDNVIVYIKRYVHKDSETVKRVEILKSVKKQKKLHWTQTPEGRRKMSLAQRKSWREKREKRKINSKDIA